MGTGAVPQVHALEVELAALRARAYGADADIDDDAAALERLAELEEWHAATARAAAADAGTRIPDSSRPSEGASLRGDLPAPATPAAVPGGAPDAASRGRALLRRIASRGVGLFALGVATALAVGLVALAVFALSVPRPDAVLSAVAGSPEPYVLRLTDFARELLIDKTTLRRYESFRGVEVWSAHSRLGNDCLLALERSSDRLLGAGCVPPGVDPRIEIYDVPVYSRDRWHAGLPDGSVLRFILSGGSVSAWLYEGTPAD